MAKHTEGLIHKLPTLFNEYDVTYFDQDTLDLKEFNNMPYDPFKVMESPLQTFKNLLRRDLIQYNQSKVVKVYLPNESVDNLTRSIIMF